MKGFGVPDVSFPYKGVASIVARPTTAKADRRIVINYGQKFMNPVSVGIGRFSIDMSDATRSAGEILICTFAGKRELSDFDRRNISLDIYNLLAQEQKEFIFDVLKQENMKKTSFLLHQII